MEITGSSATSSQSVAGKVNDTANETRESTISDFNDFLTLLTAQLRHQDPLQPLDSTQFVEQLASFSSVEQQVGSNEKLDRLIEQGSASEMSELGGWIGRTVQAEKAVFSLGADGIRLPVPENPDATSIHAVVTDNSGDEVARVEITDQSEPFVWDGKLATGRQVSSGNFGVAFAYTFDGRSGTLQDAQAIGQVVEARIDNEGPILFLDSGAVVRPSDVSALRIKAESTTSDS